jgi:hypothetical protein
MVSHDAAGIRRDTCKLGLFLLPGKLNTVLPVASADPPSLDRRRPTVRVFEPQVSPVSGRDVVL